MPSPEKCCEHYDQLDSDKQPLMSYLQEITEFILPTKTQVTTYETTIGQRQEWRRYDHVGMHSNEMLASSINGALTSAATQWFELAMENEELNQDKEVKEWLSRSARVLYAHFNDSNFGNRIQQVYLQLGGYGTGAFGCFPRYDRRGRFEGLRFMCYPVREFVFSEGTDDRPDMFYRKLTWSMRRIMSEFNKSTPGFEGYPVEMHEAIRRESPKELEKERDILVCVYYRDIYKPGSAFPQQRPIAYEVIDYKTKKRIVKSGTYEMPVMVPRWEVNADDRGWGRGPGMTALGAVRQRSKIKYYGQRALAKDVDPPIVVQFRGIFGQIRTGPGGIIYKRKGADNPAPLTSGARHDWTQVYLDELRREIEDYFYVDQLKPFHNTPEMTATEAQLRYELMMRLLGPTYGRLTYELFDPCIFRALNVLLREGRLPQPPSIILRAMQSSEGASIKVNYVGPLAKSQRAKDVQAINRAYETANSIVAATGRREALDRLNDDAAMEHALDVLGVPPEIVRSDDETQRVRERREQAERAAAQAEEALTRAEAGQKAGAGLKSVSEARRSAA